LEIIELVGNLKIDVPNNANPERTNLQEPDFERVDLTKADLKRVLLDTKQVSKNTLRISPKRKEEKFSSMVELQKLHFLKDLE
jgi:uncharacterized protein YjbI with pentapeptide repeats